MQEPKIGDRIFISYRSLHGKKNIIENGSNWVVLKIKDNVLCCGMKRAMLIESLLTKSWRYVMLEDDKDYYWNVSRN